MNTHSNPPSAPLKPRSTTRQSIFRDSYPTSRVLTYSDAPLTLHDLYLKSSIHLLLLSRDPTKNLLHPFIALSDPVFRAQVQAEVSKLKILVAKELKRRFGAESAAGKKREEALDKEEGEVPEDRDWSKDVIVGIHAHPSMNHLHLQIPSRDFHSNCIRHRRHYNSFHTLFFIDVEDFPLAVDDRRRHPGRDIWVGRYDAGAVGRGSGKALLR